MITKHIFLLSFLFGISMVSSQSNINGVWRITACEFYYNRANPLVTGPFWYQRLCYSISPCTWCGADDDIIQSSLKYGSEAGRFNLTDNSYFDMTIRILNYTYQYYYSLSKIEFAWGPDEFAQCNETTSYIEILPNRLNPALVTPNDWLRINFSQTYNSPITVATIDSPFQLSQYPVTWVHLHFEWNEITSNGLIQPAYLILDGTGGTWHPSPEPTQNPTATFNPTGTPTQISVNPTESPTQNPTLPSAKPTISPSEIPTSSPTKTPTTNPIPSPTNNPTSTTYYPTVSPTEYKFCTDDTASTSIFVSRYQLDEDDIISETVCEFCVCEQDTDGHKEEICDLIVEQVKEYDEYLQNKFMEFCGFDNQCSFDQIGLTESGRGITKCGCDIFECKPITTGDGYMYKCGQWLYFGGILAIYFMM